MITERLVWTLAHSLWQAAMVAVFAAIALRLFSRRRAEMRYAICAAAVALTIALPLATFTFHAETAAALRAALRFAGLFAGSEGEWPSLSQDLTSTWVRTVFGWIVPAWIAGVSFGAVRIAAGWRATRRIVRLASESVSEEMTTLLNSLRKQLGLACRVRLLLSAQIDTPAAVGWWRPVVLLPVAAITGLDPVLLRAVIAHELAHIRRHDFAINILQSCAEALLFYHPAVWWLSRRMRTEREHCCDDVAVRVCGDPAVYARALLALENSRAEAPAMAMAATRSPLRARLLRVLGLRFEGRSWGEVLGLAMLLFALAVGALWPVRTIQAEKIPPAATVAAAEPVSTAAPSSKASKASTAVLAAPAASAGIAPVSPSREEPSGRSIAAELRSAVARLVQDPAPQNDGGNGKATLRGQIRDNKGMPAVRGLWVTATPEERVANISFYFDEVGAGGLYTMDLPPGRYAISIHDQAGVYPGGRIQSAPRTITVVAVQSRPVDLDLEFAFIPAVKPGELWGRIGFDDGSALPVGMLPRFQLALTSDKARWITQPFTNTQGLVTFQPVAPGEYAVMLAPLPLGYFVKSVNFGNIDLTQALLPLASGASETQLRVVLTRTRPANVPPGVKVSGRILRWDPVSPSLALLAAWDGREFNMDAPPRRGGPASYTSAVSAANEFVDVANVAPRADGSFEIGAVPPGRYAIGRSAGRWSSADVSVTFDVAGDEVSGLELILDKRQSLVSFNPNAKRSISGIVESMDGAIPAFEVRMTAVQAGAFTPHTVSVTGREFSITLPEGEYRVSVSGLPKDFAVKSVTAGPLDLTEPFLVTANGIADRFTGKAIAKNGAGITIRLAPLSVK